MLWHTLILQETLALKQIYLRYFSYSPNNLTECQILLEGLKVVKDNRQSTLGALNQHEVTNLINQAKMG